jgi:hypothetical protein
VTILKPDWLLAAAAVLTSSASALSVDLQHLSPARSHVHHCSCRLNIYPEPLSSCSMVNEGFCAPCQRMLADEDIPKQRGKARWHHVDGESFQQSLDMGCHICTQSWVQFDRPGVLGPTKYSLSKENSSEFHEFSISHYIRPQEGYDSAYFFVQPWSIQHAQLIGEGRIASNSDLVVRQHWIRSILRVSCVKVHGMSLTPSKVLRSTCWTIHAYKTSRH